MNLEEMYPGIRSKIEKARSAGYTDEMIENNVQRLIYKAYSADYSEDMIRTNLGVSEDFKLPLKATWWQKGIELMTGGHVEAPGPPPKPEFGPGQMSPKTEIKDIGPTIERQKQSYPEGKINVPRSAELGFFEDPMLAVAMGLVKGVKVAAPIGQKLFIASREAIAWATGGLTDAPKLAAMGAEKVAGGVAAKQVEKTMTGAFGRAAAGVGAKRVTPEVVPRLVKPGARVMDLIKTRRTDIDTGILDSEAFVRNIEQRADKAAIPEKPMAKGAKKEVEKWQMIGTKQQNLEAVPFLIQGTKSSMALKQIGREDLIPIIQRPSKELSAIVKDVKEYYAESHEFLKKAWGEDIGFVENYVTQIWDIPKAKKSQIVSHFAKRNPFLKERTIPTFEDGIELGLTPKTTNIAELLRVYDQYKIKTVHNMKFAESLKGLVDDAGNPLMMRSDKAPVDWTKIDHPAMNRAMAIGKDPLVLSKVPVKVSPEIAKEVKVIFDEPINNKWINAYETANAFLKKSMLSISLFHHQALTESALSAGIGKKALQLWNPIKIVEAMKNKNYAIFKEMDLAKDAIKHNVTFGALEDIQRGKVVDALKSVEDATKKIPILNKVTKGIGKANKLWDAALWDYYHNTLKLYAYEANVAKSLKSAEKAMQKKAGRSLLPEETEKIKNQIGLFINDSFGGQNWEMDKVLGNPKVRQMMQWFWLAPDWCFSSDIRVLGKNGWKYYNEIKAGDEILSFNKDTQTVQWEAIKEIYINDKYNGPMINLHNRGRDVRMTPDHRCYIYNKKTGSYDTVLASGLQPFHKIPRCAPNGYESPEEQLFSDIFIKLVGWFVSDGYTKKCVNKLGDGSEKEYRYGKITQSKPHTVDIIKAICKMKYHTDKPAPGGINKDGKRIVGQYPKYVFTIPKHYFQEMENLGLCDGLNWEFLSKLTKNQLSILYDTLYLADGTGQRRLCGQEKPVFYATMIQIMLGLPSTFYQQEERCWRTRILHPKNRMLPTNGKVTDISYKGTIWCPSVPSKYFIAERKGLIFITGNTISVLKQAAAPVKGAAMMATAKGDIPKALAGKALAKRGSLFWAKAATYYNLIAQSVNYRNTKKEYGEGRFTWDNAPGNKLNIFIGRNEDGTERYLRMGKQFREVVEWGEDPLKKVGAKLSPLLREGIRQFSAHDPGSGYPTEWAEKDSVWKTIPERAKSIAEMPIPFSLRPYVESRPGVFMFTFPTKKGMTNYKTVKLFKEAMKDGDKKEVRKLYIHALENNLNAYQLLKTASSAVKADMTYDDKGVAKDILNELREMLPDARKDAYKLYKQRGTITPNVEKQMNKLIESRVEIETQKKFLNNGDKPRR